ncbi:MAG: DNA endonuclease SmrA [Alcanivorax sp.]|nr:DNA endonuclease SmrA [Alcanivorax sp.]
MTDKDLDLFYSELGDVRPIGPSDRIRPKGRPAPTLSQQARRDAAQHARRLDPNPLTLPDEVAQVGAHDIVGLKKNGVQEGVYRKLRLGKYEIQAKLDLHRVLLRDARTQVYDFIRHAHEAGLRTVMITHGKGLHSETPARMKSHTLHWLEEFDLVLAFHSAKPAHGGAGATYVLLRKSSEASLKTREVYAERSRAQRKT